jgi:dihydrofolate reductase/thymidylate synthase
LKSHTNLKLNLKLNLDLLYIKMGVVSLIVAGTMCKDPIKGVILGIGKNNKIPWNVKEDLARFKGLTQGHVVVMGRKTYESIGRPLPGRINFVLSKQNFLHKDVTIFNNFESLQNELDKRTENIYIIGGTALYNEYILKADSIYLTEIYHKYECDTFFPEIPGNFKIVRNSEKFETKSGIKYRFIDYLKSDKKLNEMVYLNHCKEILDKGTERTDRTGTGTVSIFGSQIRFDISESYPLLTTKFVSHKNIIEELLWILRGDTDVKILEDRGVKIWSANVSREFLDNQGKFDYTEGILEYGYGYQLRRQNGTFDQLEYILNLLKTDPFSRRILWNLWTGSDIKKSVLVPCHYSFQLYVEENYGIKYLSGMITLRSQDFFLGNPYNLGSYTALIYLLAKKTGMVPKDLIMSFGDAHIYSNHLNQVTEQLNKLIRSSPKLIISDLVIDKDWKDLTLKDFEVIGYYPHSSITAKMAV